MNQKYQSRYHPELITDNFLKKYFKENGYEYDASEDERYFEITCLGYFDLSNIGEVGIYVYGKETEKPHFHLIGNGFETAIGIFEPVYIHDGVDRLNIDQIKDLSCILKSENIGSINHNWWNDLVFNWNDFYDTNYSYNNMPDYTKLKWEKD